MKSLAGLGYTKNEYTDTLLEEVSKSFISYTEIDPDTSLATISISFE